MSATQIDHYTNISFISYGEATGAESLIMSLKAYAHCLKLDQKYENTEAILTLINALLRQLVENRNTSKPREKTDYIKTVLKALSDIRALANKGDINATVLSAILHFHRDYINDDDFPLPPRLTAIEESLRNILS